MIAMMYQYPQLHGDLSTIAWVIPRAEFHRYLLSAEQKRDILHDNAARFLRLGAELGTR